MKIKNNIGMFIRSLLSRKRKIKLMFLSIILICISSCSKTKGDYYDYVNSVEVFNGNAYEYFKAQPAGIYDSFMLVVNRFPDIIDTLQTDSVTILAPTNSSFTTAIQNLNVARQANKKSPLYLSTIDSAQMDTILSRYIIHGNITTDDVKAFVDGITTAAIKYQVKVNLQYEKSSAAGILDGGPQYLYVSDTKGSSYTQYWVRTTTTSVNLHTNNAIIHVLKPGHEFGYGEFTTRLLK